MSSEEYKHKTKCFLERKLTEYNIKIQKLKKRRKIIKVLFVACITLSIACSAVCATLCTFVVPPFIIPILSTSGAVAAAFSVKFNLEGKKLELSNMIEQLDKIKRKIDYVVSCNGNFNESEHKQVLNELTKQD